MTEPTIREKIDNLLCRVGQTYDKAQHKTLLVRAHRNLILAIVEEEIKKCLLTDEQIIETEEACQDILDKEESLGLKFTAQDRIAKSLYTVSQAQLKAILKVLK